MDRQTIAVAAPAERSADLVAELRAASVLDEAGGSPALWLVVADRIEDLRSQLAALPGSAPALLVIAPLRLPAVIEVMRDNARVLGVIDANEPPASVVAYARGLLGPPPAPAAVLAVRDAPASSAAVAELRAAAIGAGLGGARVDAVEQCADELLINALYAAPVGAQGQRLFAAYSPRQRRELRTEHEVSVAHARDNERFVVTVRDAFGSLDRQRVIDRLHRAANESDVVERKLAGAGLGLFLVAQEANSVAIDVVPGLSTTITCAFEPRSGPASRLSLRVHPPAAQRTHARVIRTAAARRRRLLRALRWSAGPAILVALLVLYKIFWVTHLAIATTPPDAIVEIDGWVAARDADGRAKAADLRPFTDVRVHVYRAGFSPISTSLRPGDHAIALAPVPSLTVESEPTGATVEIGGSIVATTPAAITWLSAGERVPAVISLPGYRRATTELVIPASGENARHVEKLVPDPAQALVTLVSDPPGARVLRQGEQPTADRVYTPAQIAVPKDAETRFTLEMRGRVPQEVVVGPGALDRSEVRAELARSP